MADLEIRTRDTGSEIGFQSKIKTQPSVEPVTTAEFKTYVKVDFTDDDTLIGEILKAARRQAEQYTQRAFLSQVITLFWDRYQQEMSIPYPPNISIDKVELRFEDQTEVLTLNTDYFVLGLETKRIRIPTVSSRQSLEIEITAGYGTSATDVPLDIKLAIMKIAANYYDNRVDFMSDAANLIPENSRSLLDQYVVYNF